MKFSFLKGKPVFYIILSGFVIMVYVVLSLLNSALKGKEKDFNDKLFFVVSFYEEHLIKDSVLMKSFTDDRTAINLVQDRIKDDIDSVLQKNEIPTDYVYAIGKIKPGAIEPSVSRSQKIWTGNNLLWSSDSLNNPGLMSTKLRIAGLGPRSAELYYVKVFFPHKPSYLFYSLLPLMIVSVLTLVTLFFCFLTLLSIIRKQNRLAETRNDFINNMTHELKTPLFTISIASKMLAEQEPIKENPKYGSYIESIQQETGRLTKLVDKVLQTAALEKRQLQPDKKIIDVHAVIRSAVKSMELVRREQQASIELLLHAGQHQINADETHMEGVVYSLVDNALKYSNGPARITIVSKNSGNNIIISFIDEGIGFDMDTKNLIFERFFRAHTGNLHDVKGYGIGLSYVKSVIEAHDGSVVVNSTVGKGSEFILILPFIQYGSKSGDTVGGR